MPQSNSELEAAADAGYVFSGETTIVLNGNSMNVTNNGSTVSKPLPPSGVVYVKSTSCSTGYARKQVYAAAPGCGNVRVSGTYNKDLTIGADNDIIIMDDFKSSDTDTVLGGLIANNFVRVYHPVNDWDEQRQRLRQQRRSREHPDRRRDPGPQPLVHRRQLVLRQRPRAR